MTCSYCGSRNDELDLRCRRCGRKPGDTLNSDFMVHRTTGALATKPRPVVMVEDPPTARPVKLAGAVQGSLFSQNVVTMPNRTAPRAPRARTAQPSTVTGTKPQVRRTHRPVAEGQGEFEFLAPVQNKAK